jgi:hypothetical protein
MKIVGRVIATLSAPKADSTFVTKEVPELRLSYQGIDADRHSGLTRITTGREPWYPRGTEIRNERQLSLLAPLETALIAERLRIPEIKPEWIGGNLVIEDIPNFSELPPSTRLEFEQGVVLVIDGITTPCKFAGEVVARYTNRPDITLAFAPAAMRIRGLVAWVERPGSIKAGEKISVRLKR